MSDLSFRPATPADVEAVVALVTAAYRGEASTAGWTSEAHLLEGQRTDAAMVGAAVDDPDGTIVLAERHGELLGCIQVTRAGTDAHFGMFAVDPHPPGRRGGLGAAHPRRGPRPQLVALHRHGPRGDRPERGAHRLLRAPWLPGHRRDHAVPLRRRALRHPQRDDLHFIVLRREL